MPAAQSPSLVHIASHGYSASVNPAGAELMSLDHDGRPLLWPGDTNSWAERAPVLFPTIGLVTGGEIRVGGRAYPMPPHGFAKRSLFTVTQRGPDRCSLTLEATSSTREHYPFAFGLRLDYSLDAAGLRMAATISNPGSQTLPASFGFHPGFRWPLEPGVPKSSYTIAFADDRRITTKRPAQGFFTDESTVVDLPNGHLALNDDLFVGGGLFLVAPRSSEVRFGSPDGKLALTVAYENCPDVMVWMKPGAEFLCIEPWHGRPDPAGFKDDFSRKPGLANIPPGESIVVAMTVRADG
ncbi:MAG: aldose 1-epimerase family protein [Chelatococcus sp.]|jgi:galactose mutarotase-like enzyme|uniref:aldose 1-epimerase family protein n=1 Tax=unclassified Chelatococcus TaxID=2638111 RepID=UPI001BCB8CA0|nr:MULTISPECIES: aldose 1-epimerase family protein [unclassified Chelatococcus]CAH1658584.1 Galactose mutarotase-like enzyme [Hyphomicrobiales bacterium]MBS7742152.1 aldose 1-epimerase family protein [Chelatococcus sp. HY11]MBX3538480.1 aldose 1-epimerase family protein [Chelatococcus sp.]MBX3542730.1 aldose 1-epimerase family protein [Chelatococcus sp.]MCO5075054.1 aldose 1-epimerase family protein [Chelatococcus sp.]